MEVTIHIVLDTERMLGAMPGSSVALEFEKDISNNIDQWGTPNIRAGAVSSPGGVALEVKGEMTELRRTAIENAVLRQIEYCLAAFGG